MNCRLHGDVDLRQLPVICGEVGELAPGSLSLFVLSNLLWCHKRLAHVIQSFPRPHFQE